MLLLVIDIELQLSILTDCKAFFNNTTTSNLEPPTSKFLFLSNLSAIPYF